ncbi:MAG: DUF2269 domain-containing protein [Rubrivivax sp.]|nr:DUF2269 domain-containing protein [Rubrivivax sp.]
MIVKWVHVLSSAVLFGTGIGSAWYLLLASLSARRRAGDARALAEVAHHVVLADLWFTATTVIVQPASGLVLVQLAGLPLSARWLAQSLALFALAVACWLPVVWLQIRLRALARQAVAAGVPLPAAYWRHFAAWVVLGFPAFFAFLGVFWLMVAKPP